MHSTLPCICIHPIGVKPPVSVTGFHSLYTYFMKSCKVSFTATDEGKPQILSIKIGSWALNSFEEFQG